MVPFNNSAYFLKLVVNRWTDKQTVRQTWPHIELQTLLRIPKEQNNHTDTDPASQPIFATSCSLCDLLLSHQMNEGIKGYGRYGGYYWGEGCRFLKIGLLLGGRSIKFDIKDNLSVVLPRPILFKTLFLYYWMHSSRQGYFCRM